MLVVAGDGIADEEMIIIVRVEIELAATGESPAVIQIMPQIDAAQQLVRRAGGLLVGIARLEIVNAAIIIVLGIGEEKAERLRVRHEAVAGDRVIERAMAGLDAKAGAGVDAVIENLRVAQESRAPSPAVALTKGWPSAGGVRGSRLTSPPRSFRIVLRTQRSRSLRCRRPGRRATRHRRPRGRRRWARRGWTAGCGRHRRSWRSDRRPGRGYR